jgi:hypothetical protein
MDGREYLRKCDTEFCNLHDKEAYITIQDMQHIKEAEQFAGHGQR